MSARPRVSVVVCTHNRAKYLARALASVGEQESRGMPYEVVVVDNRSTDDTPAAVERFAATGAPVRYVYESELGLCNARNRGWREAAGEIVAYLDDDAVALPGWLVAVSDAFAFAPSVGVVGGRVEPIWEGARPEWLGDDVALSLTILDWSPDPKVIKDLRMQWLVGANLALPRVVLEEVGGFDPGLDRIGTQMLSSGDVFLEKRVQARGYQVLYFPAMAVRHLVPADRLRKEWFRRRYYWQGISDAVMQLLEEAPRPATRARLAAKRAAKLLGSPRACMSLVMPTDDPRAFARKCWTWIAVGHIAGLLGAARR